MPPPLWTTTWPVSRRKWAWNSVVSPPSPRASILRARLFWRNAELGAGFHEIAVQVVALTEGDEGLAVQIAGLKMVAPGTSDTDS